MKCPLFTIMDKRTQLGEESDYCECLQEECAWWVPSFKNCAVYMIGFNTMGLPQHFEQLLKKLRPELFRTG